MGHRHLHRQESIPHSHDAPDAHYTYSDFDVKWSDIAVTSALPARGRWANPVADRSFRPENAIAGAQLIDALEARAPRAGTPATIKATTEYFTRDLGYADVRIFTNPAGVMGVVARDPATNTILVAFKGAERADTEDMATIQNSAWGAVGQLIGIKSTREHPIGGEVDKAMLASFNRTTDTGVAGLAARAGLRTGQTISSEMIAYIEGIQTRIANAGGDKPTVIPVGHSLGAAHAMLFAADLSLHARSTGQPHLNPSLIAISQPPLATRGFDQNLRRALGGHAYDVHDPTPGSDWLVGVARAGSLVGRTRAGEPIVVRHDASTFREATSHFEGTDLMQVQADLGHMVRSYAAEMRKKLTPTGGRGTGTPVSEAPSIDMSPETLRLAGVTLPVLPGVTGAREADVAPEGGYRPEVAAAEARRDQEQARQA